MAYIVFRGIFTSSPLFTATNFVFAKKLPRSLFISSAKKEVGSRVFGLAADFLTLEAVLLRAEFRETGLERFTGRSLAGGLFCSARNVFRVLSLPAKI